MKKISFILAFILCIILIYNSINNNKINYVSISDKSIIMNNSDNYNDYLRNYLLEKNRLSTFNTYFINDNALSLYKDLKNNRTIRINNNEYYFKKVLRESDFVVINVGMEEFSINYDKYDLKNNYQIFSSLFLNIEKLVKELKKYALGKVVFLGLYNPTNYYDSNVDSFFYDIDIKLNELMMKNNIIYINLYELVKSNKYKDNSAFINSLGNEKIANCIKFYLK